MFLFLVMIVYKGVKGVAEQLVMTVYKCVKDVFVLI